MGTLIKESGGRLSEFRAKSHEDIDRDQVASDALQWFQTIGFKKFRYSDKDFLESAAGLAIVKAIDTFDPNMGMNINGWVRNKMTWAVQDALRNTEGGSRGKAKLAGKKKVLLSALKNPGQLASYEEDKDAALYLEDAKNVLRTEKDPRTSKVMISRIEGKTFKQIGEDIGLSESMAHKINKVGENENLKDIRAFTYKDCSACGRNKPAGAFYRDSARKDGLRSECQECNRSMRGVKRRFFARKLPWPNKICNSCQITKNVSEFHKQDSGRHGVQGICANCANGRNRRKRRRKAGQI